ncbi:MAG: PQQ-binding-like beta-propeller repeat protein [Terriglobia bacterium]
MRRAKRTFVPGLLILLSLGAPAWADSQPAMFRGGPEHTGVYPGTGLTNFEGVQWKFKTRGHVLSSPAVYAGTVYVGSDDRNLYALDAATGAEKWHFETQGGAINSSPAVSTDAVYFLSADGSFYALDPQTGKQLWKFETEGERRFEAKGLHGVTPHQQTIPDPWDFYLSSPALYDGGVYFGCGDGNVYALDAQTGRLRWKFHTRGVVHSSPAISAGVVYIGSWDSYLYALDAATGQEKWKFKTGEDPKIFNQVGIQSSPAVAEGTVYFGCRDAHLYAVDAKTGQLKWNFPTQGSWVIVSPVVREGVVYFATSDSALFHAVDAATGKERFTLPTGMFVFSSPTVAGDMAYFGVFNGKLLAVDLKAGKQRWEFQTAASKTSLLPLLLPDGKPDYARIFGSDFWEDMVVAVHKLFALGAIVSSPTVVDGVLYVGSADGYVYALKLAAVR